MNDKGMNRFVSHSELTEEERQALKDAKLNVETWYALHYPDNKIPHAIFRSGVHAETYRQQFSRTSVIEPYNMIIK